MSINFINETYDWKNLSLEQYLNEGNYPSNWSEFFERKDIQNILSDISKNMNRTITIYPSPNMVFKAFRLPLNKVKVLILGQDCYHNPGSATGLCFSIPPNSAINPSLRNIYQELENEGFKPVKNGDLTHWMNQGCLMLNTALTVEKGTPESHLHLWYDFSEKLLDYIGNNSKNIAWLLMGAKALQFKKFANPNNGHICFCTSHTSPFSAHKGFKDIPAFLGSNVFKNINSFLEKNLKQKINW